MSLKFCTGWLVFAVTVVKAQVAERDGVAIRDEQAAEQLKADGSYDPLMQAVDAANDECDDRSPFRIFQTNKLSDGIGDPDMGQFGQSVAVSGDTAVVGAFLEDVAGETDQGAAYVFVRTARGGWVQQARLLAPDGVSDDRFGSSVAVVGDTIVVGAMGDDLLPPPQPPNHGSAYVFVVNAGVWTLQQKLSGDLSDSANFGISVAMSGDTILAGTLGRTFDAQEKGSAYVFVRSGSTWLRQAKLEAADFANNDRFGFCVALEGNTALVGAYRKRVGTNNHQGAAYVFVRNGTNWTQQARLVADDGAQFENFGFSVGLSGNTAVVGTLFGNDYHGSAYIFVRSGGQWLQQAELADAGGVQFEHFGRSVAISGELAIIGSDSGNTNNNFETEGTAHAFTRSGTAWTQRLEFFANDAAPLDSFGSSVAISGTTLIVGAETGRVGNNGSQGSAYLFRLFPFNTAIEADGD